MQLFSTQDNPDTQIQTGHSCAYHATPVTYAVPPELKPRTPASDLFSQKALESPRNIWKSWPMLKMPYFFGI